MSERHLEIVGPEIQPDRGKEIGTVTRGLVLDAVVLARDAKRIAESREADVWPRGLQLTVSRLSEAVELLAGQLDEVVNGIQSGKIEYAIGSD
ncbi:hypothetical protein [Leifsonia sp. 1010]|uniref:hypothetical protein n=1 Tax=Leifsonia sp. 1010 TaxID=2817769 RepID=UPI002866F3A8|nr:hypothetical protein [Leifsonia sp. 1010]MDR6612493.1 class 3 adenylate cyclase [Leifsonia sp. 1010]